MLAAIVGYLLGSIPFGLLITQAAGLGDVRKIGSGNIGATNVLRTGRRELAALTLVLDAAKGVRRGADRPLHPLGRATQPLYASRGDRRVPRPLLSRLARLQGRQGRRHASSACCSALAWPVGLIFCAVWLVIAFAQRYLVARGAHRGRRPRRSSPMCFLMGWAPDGIKFAAVAALLAALLIYNHRANIGRLLNGTEPKIGSEKKAEPPDGKAGGPPSRRRRSSPGSG